MDLTARYVADSRRVIDEVEFAAITNPDLPRATVVRLTTRLTEMLRTVADHAERLAESNTQLRTDSAELESQVRALHEALTQATAPAA
ncbi:hypothetical protein [Streptomyces swartbergensis]|uniref:Uncharacterized protein n=1 Tax=Streptomyces swartbergensis TaxID=487165 RepID=A0A243SBE9_9ACTN|nr:hypothetical protein [Streptomyces swartbergensis]OUD04656.1 hypothetical protein CA983_02555 [Streptomyces swartbergensis]